MTKYKRRGLCNRCYRYEWTQARPACTIDDCDSPSPHGSGYCGRHHHRFVRYGDPLAGPGRGTPGKPRGIRSMTGRYVTKQGYVKVRTDRTGPERWTLEHRLVMEQILGRMLYPDEQVHHRDGVKANNTPENLELWVKGQPTGQRAGDVLTWARMIVARYEGSPVV